MVAWALHYLSSGSHRLSSSSSASDFDLTTFSGIFRRLLLASNSLSKKLILLCLKYRDSGNIITLKYDQIGDPKRSFLNFLKYGENKENDIFSIDNTIVLKKVHNMDSYKGL